MAPPLLVIVGASGAGRRVIDIALDVLDASQPPPFAAVQVVDDAPSEFNLSRLEQHGLPYAGTTADWLALNPPAYFSIGLGDTRTRQHLAARFLTFGHTPVTLIAPTARVSRTAHIGPGSVVSPGVDLSANVFLGEFVHIMANAAISHDVHISNHVNVNPGAIVAGNCSISEHVTVGAGAVVLQGLSVGHCATIGASACVVSPVKAHSVVKGVPAA